jgi:hypothetical protein
MANAWFRLYAEFATDPKVQMLSEADQRRYLMLLCIRCSNGDVTLHDDEVAFQLRISNEQWQQTKAVLIAKGLIDNASVPSAWDKRQYLSDSSAARVAAHRAKKKQPCNVTVTPPDTDTDTDTEESKALSAASQPQPAKKKTSFDPLTAKPQNVSCEAWADFVAHRNAKSKLTAKACELIAAKLAGHPDPDAVLNQSVENGWTGIFPEKFHAASKQSNGQGSNSAVDQVKRAIAEREARSDQAQSAHDRQALVEDDRDLRPPLDVEFRRVG